MTGRNVLLALVAAALLTGIVMVAGGYNVSAAAGHLRPVAALLHWTMQNSVTLRSGASLPEDLDSRRWALAGAGHYDLVCRDCHGAPGQPLGAVAGNLEPPPPHILEALEGWRPEELHWIVKHGIKMTAMPAWPSQHRDDEVWSVVAFLRRLPDMSADEYRRAVMGPLADTPGRPVSSAFDESLKRCARCHDYDGRGLSGAGFPRLDGLSATYLHASLQAFAAGQRHSGIMQAHASVVPGEHLETLARHYGETPSPSGETHSPPDDADPSAGESGTSGAQPSGSRARGRRIALEGIPEQRVPACAACHGPVPYVRSADYPALAGQPAPYLETQLRLFRQGRRGGTDFAHVMTLSAEGLSDRDIADVARYYADP